MKKLNFSTTINAPKERVWNILWDDATYRQWAAPFHEGSHAVSDWKEGSKILFLGPEGSGMTSRIARLIPNEFMSFEHLGEVKNGVEDFATAQEKGWAWGCENYSLRENGSGTELLVELDSDGNYDEYFNGAFPKALQKVKELAEAQKITPFLWFDHQAEEAANFYVSVFKNSKIKDVFRQGDKALTVGFQLDGQDFTVLNGGPMFKFNPSVSFFAVCETEAETDAVWQALSDGGMVLMPLDKYPWSEKYGFVQDRYGLSWQISLGKTADTGGQKFTPSLLFTGEQGGKAEAALRFYTSLFSGTSIDGIMHYGAGEEGPEGTVKHAQFKLCHQTFMVMDNPMEQAFTFNEAVSFVVHCEGQGEVDFFWNTLIADGGAESQCGWLKDKFGLSWQIVPTELLKLLSDPDPAKAQRAMGAMMQMKKIDIEKLRQAADDVSKTVITVETTVDAPIEKVWQLWTKPEHIVHWNHASDDWHSPRAENDLRVGGAFSYHMAAKDGSFEFDFGGVYDYVSENQRIESTLGDGRIVQVNFSEGENGTHVLETFEAENMNSVELQRGGWQAILDNFKKYAEGSGN